MPTPLTHALAGITVAAPLRLRPTPRRTWIAAACCAMLPDIDITWYSRRMPHDTFLAHRGITHSLAFAAVVAAIVTGLAFTGPAWRGARLRLWLTLALAMASHGLLDALTRYDRGVMLLAPFSRQRFVFPWHPLALPFPPSLPGWGARLWWIAVWEVSCVWLPCAVILGATLFWQSRERPVMPAR